MAANLMNGRYAGKEAAWHREAKCIWGDRHVTATEAVRLADMDYQVQRVPIQYSLNGQTYDAPNYLLVREPLHDDPEPRVLGTCWERYEPIQNMDAARVLDPLTEKWPVESIAALGNGEKIFLMLDAGSVEVAGEPVHSFFAFVDRKDAGGRAHIVYTPVRMVCENTLVAGMAAATTNIEFNHYKGAIQDIGLAVKLMQELRESQKAVLESLEQLAAKHIGLRQAADIVNAAFPLPKKTGRALLADNLRALGAQDAPAELERLGGAVANYERSIERQERFRTETMALYAKLNDEFPAIAGTAYAAYNAVVEHIDHKQRTKSGAFALFGDGASYKAAAFRAAMAVKPSKN